MTAPSYTTDLSLICAMETGDTFIEFSGYTLGDNAALETDWYLQGASCASDEANAKTGVGHSIGFDYGSNITFNTGDCFFAWMMCMAGNAMDTFANGGYRVLMGSSSTVFRGWYVGGRDFGRNPYGGWTNVAVDPTATAQDNDHGTPTTWRVFGIAIVMTSSINKGRPNCADVYRKGRGSVKIEHGETSNYGTFAGIAVQNDDTSNRWGLFQKEGTGYLWKGLLSFGTATNPCDFRDSNVNVTIDDCPRTYAAFNRIEIRGTGSRVDWTGINFQALNESGLAKGELEVIDDADFNVDSCGFTGMSTFIFLPNSTIIDTAWRRGKMVTQGGGVFDGCLFSRSIDPAAFLVSNLDEVDYCDFVSAGTGHAIQLTADHAGGSFTMVGCSFTGYASSDGSSGNEAIYNNSGGAVTINVSGGDTPTIRNGTNASTTVVAGSVTVKVIVQTADGTKIENAIVLLFASGTGPFPSGDTVTITNSGTTATVAHTGHGLASNDKVLISGASLGVNNGVQTITVTGVDAYTYTLSSAPGSNPTGTITSTFVLLSGLTNSSGLIQMSKVFPSTQDVTGWARKSTGSPLYQSGPLSGTVDNSTGATFTSILIPDE